MWCLRRLISRFYYNPAMAQTKGKQDQGVSKQAMLIEKNLAVSHREVPIRVEIGTAAAAAETPRLYVKN